jgi:hypothetical protein
MHSSAEGGSIIRRHFAKEDEILVGFFSFISTANVIDPWTEKAETKNVTASYIASGVTCDYSYAIHTRATKP